MSDWTPGPWEMRSQGVGCISIKWDGTRTPVYSFGVYVPGRVSNRAFTQGEEGDEAVLAEADARLMAAAPSLAAFVESFAKAEHHMFCGAHPEMDDGPCSCAKGVAESLLSRINTPSERTEE